MPGCDQEEMTKSSGMAFSDRVYSINIVNEILIRATSCFFIYSCFQNSLLVFSHTILVKSVLLEKTEVNYFHLLSQGIFIVSLPRYENV